MKDFEVLIIEGAYPSSVAMSRDILDAATQVAARLGLAAPSWGLYSLAGGRVPLRDGISVETRPLPPRRRDNRSVCVIPGLGADPQAIAARLVDALRQAARRSEDVGERFVDESRRIHSGAAEERAIRGQASRSDVIELMDEGIPVLPVPPDKDDLH